jgi:hypothetical protein
MTTIFLRCRDAEYTGDTIRLECTLNPRDYIDFTKQARGVLTEDGESYEFELLDNGVIGFVSNDLSYLTDLNELELRVGTRVKVREQGAPWHFDIAWTR